MERFKEGDGEDTANRSLCWGRRVTGRRLVIELCGGKRREPQLEFLDLFGEVAILGSQGYSQVSKASAWRNWTPKVKHRRKQRECREAEELPRAIMQWDPGGWGGVAFDSHQSG